MRSGNRVVGAAKGVVIAAPSSGAGKTVTTMAVLAALRRRGHAVRPAKCGPDYIDPQFLAAAAQAPCINLDPWAMSQAQLRARAGSHAAAGTLMIVEGVMGLFDGAAGGGASTADVADALGLPVILVIDASRQAQSIAAVVHGFSTFCDRVQVNGVIATRVASDRHAAMLAKALADVAVTYLGAVRSDPKLALGSRHLGLVQAVEQDDLAGVVDLAADAIAGAIDLDGLVALCGGLKTGGSASMLPPLGQRIGVACDTAFGFAYRHIIEDWQAQGAEVCTFSPLADQGPPADADAVFLPGGYPELYAGRIAAAQGFRCAMQAARDRGAVIYGECGGYMVLGEGLIDAHGGRHTMLGLLGHTTSFVVRQRQLGYRKLETLGTAPLPRALRGHEFHYTTLVDGSSDDALFKSWDSGGCYLGEIGGRRDAVMGSYAHIIAPAPAPAPAPA